MAVKPTTTITLEKNRRGFMNNLSSMAFEWLLIFLLFVDAALSYLLVKLAHHCELQTPCLLCSRLDHVFGNEKPEFYMSLLCSNHRIEISSLISCQIHGKLADARRMCEECLMSFAIKTKTSPESCRLLLGKFGVYLDHCGFQSPFLTKNIIPDSVRTWTCSCCNKTWSAGSNTQKLLKLPVGVGTLKPNAKPPLPHFPGHGRLVRRDNFKKRYKISGSTPPRWLENIGVDPLSHVGYTELKINSDTESEFLFSDDDDDDRNSVSRENSYSKDTLGGILPKAHTEYLASVNWTQQGSDPGPSLLDQCIQLDVSDRHDVDGLSSDNYIGHGLGELNWEQANPKPYPSALLELISLDDVPPSSNVINEGGVSDNKFDGPLPHNSTHFMLSELVVPNDASPSSNVMTIPVAVSPEKLDVIGTDDIGHKCVIKHLEVSVLVNTNTEECFNNDHAVNDDAPSMSINLGSSDECKLSNCKGKESYGMIADISDRSNSAKVRDQILSVDEIGQSPDYRCSRRNCQLDEFQRIDASSAEKIQMLQKSPSLERNDSGYESFDGLSVCEIEGESSFDRLKRQVEYDRTCMSSLYKELEAERNASEVAANQAMAMITRLQEEKASLQMDALQYLRMMEEQAEYDMEALGKANDLLADKEKEVQDLEAELEFYRVNYPDESKVENLALETNKSEVDKDKNNKIMLLDFEGEKLYISQCLKELERKLYPIKSLSTGATQTEHQKEENSFLMPKVLSASRTSTAECSGVLIEENGDVIEENNHLDFGRIGRIDLIAIENEFAELNGRLQALEADRNLLEHALNSLRNGNDGLQFIKEVAHQLQELRKIR